MQILSSEDVYKRQAKSYRRRDPSIANNHIWHVITLMMTVVGSPNVDRGAAVVSSNNDKALSLIHIYTYRKLLMIERCPTNLKYWHGE